MHLASVAEGWGRCLLEIEPTHLADRVIADVLKLPCKWHY